MLDMEALKNAGIDTEEGMNWILSAANFVSWKACRRRTFWPKSLILT